MSRKSSGILYWSSGWIRKFQSQILSECFFLFTRNFGRGDLQKSHDDVRTENSCLKIISKKNVTRTLPRKGLRDALYFGRCDVAGLIVILPSLCEGRKEGRGDVSARRGPRKNRTFYRYLTFTSDATFYSSGASLFNN